VAVAAVRAVVAAALQQVEAVGADDSRLRGSSLDYSPANLSHLIS
jgi:hypothetical protein